MILKNIDAWFNEEVSAPWNKIILSANIIPKRILKILKKIPIQIVCMYVSLTSDIFFLPINCAITVVTPVPNPNVIPIRINNKGNT